MEGFDNPRPSAVSDWWKDLMRRFVVLLSLVALLTEAPVLWVSRARRSHTKGKNFSLTRSAVASRIGADVRRVAVRFLGSSRGLHDHLSSQREGIVS